MVLQLLQAEVKLLLLAIKIDTGNLRLSGNTIESLTGDINLDADSGTVRINSTSALQLPKGDTASRPTPATGMIRYNTDTSICMKAMTATGLHLTVFMI